MQPQIDKIISRCYNVKQNLYEIGEDLDGER
jgi:hypothetical protein